MIVVCAACRDAQDAARGRDGYDFFGNRLRVEMSRGARDRGPPPAPPTFRGRGTGFRVLIKGLPISASWQDLKVSECHVAPISLLSQTACCHHKYCQAVVSFADTGWSNASCLICSTVMYWKVVPTSLLLCTYMAWPVSILVRPTSLHAEQVLEI